MTRRARTRSVRLPEKFDTSAALEFHASLIAVRGHDVRLEAGKVGWIGGLGSQLLVSAVRTWQADGHRLEIRGAASELIEGLRHLGVPPESVGLEANR